ncbi:MAG: TetR/AcrR family transcriptional regulator [Pseudomonadota bacterium]|nr:TetR/AcrR family transcriptional regulator [Pseudomonadota bacterium]
MKPYLVNPKLSKTQIKTLESALSLFVKKGFFNTSIPDLVADSGVSTGSIYHAFKDKQSIAEALMDTLLEQINREQQAILANNTDSWSRFYELSKWMINTADQYPQVMQFIFNAQHKEFMPELPPICSSQPFLTLRQVIQQGMDEKVLIKMDLMVAASSSFGGVMRLIQLGLDNMLDNPLPSYLDSITKTCWRSIAQQ